MLSLHLFYFRTSRNATMRKRKVVVQEILANESLVERIANTTAIAEVKALDDFFQMLAVDSAKAFYGPGHVVAAAEQGAVSKLLIADSLYRYCAHEPLLFSACQYC